MATNTNPEKPKVTSSGIILGPDGKPCKPCTAFRNWSKQQKAGSTSALMSSLAFGTSPAPDKPPVHCPADVEQLGNATWTFLHTTAAYYPERPTPNQRANMLSLIRAIPILYPCSHCANDFGQDIKVNPPDVSSRAGLSKWLCQRHNEVNVKLGKKTFDCGLEKLDERWKDGPSDGSCD
ncbi:FAD-dependent thiol oxidase [Marasmius fiardii PR-910]|nr:FAD-dependent thiol oxidase [Marasmius fiardii PR-910]